MFNKKGQLGTIRDIILLLLVASLFAVFLVSLKDNTFFERSYAARDLSLLEHAIYASPGEILEYNYYPISQKIIETIRKSSGDLRGGGALATDTITIERVERIDLSQFDFNFALNKIGVSTKGLDNPAIYFAYLKKEIDVSEFSGPKSFVFRELKDLEIIKSE